MRKKGKDSRGYFHPLPLVVATLPSSMLYCRGHFAKKKKILHHPPGSTEAACEENSKRKWMPSISVLCAAFYHWPHRVDHIHTVTYLMDLLLCISHWSTLCQYGVASGSWLNLKRNLTVFPIFDFIVKEENVLKFLPVKPPNPLLSYGKVLQRGLLVHSGRPANLAPK